MASTKHKPRVGYQDGGAIPPPIPVADPGAGGGLTTGTVGGATPPPIPIADPGSSQPKYVGISAPIPASHQLELQPRRMRRGMRRVGYQDGGEVSYDESVPRPIMRPKPRPEAPDDTIYPTTAPDWGDTGADPYQAAMAVGYAGGGDVQPGADINKRAALLAGLRKRYDAMIAMAQGAHAHGDIKTAAHLASKAHDMVPDGKNLTHNVTPDGHILSVVHGRGGVHSTHPMTSDQFHHYLVGPATSFDHVIDNGVGHNLHIASGRQQPRVQEHPNDPIHRVRQVLQHTRQMYGLHNVGRPAAPTAPSGYGVGG